LLVNGAPADGVTLNGAHTSATFTFSFNPVVAQGSQTMTIAAGAITRDGDPASGIAAFNASFRYDAVLLQVASTNPPFPGGAFTRPGPFTYDVTFNEVVDPASVQPTDLVLGGMAGATVSGVTLQNGNTTARFTIGGVSTEGTLTASLAAGAIVDAFGNPGAAF